MEIAESILYRLVKHVELSETMKDGSRIQLVIYVNLHRNHLSYAIEKNGETIYIDTKFSKTADAFQFYQEYDEDDCY